MGLERPGSITTFGASGLVSPAPERAAARAQAPRAAAKEGIRMIVEVVALGRTKCLPKRRLWAPTGPRELDSSNGAVESGFFSRRAGPPQGPRAAHALAIKPQQRPRPEASRQPGRRHLARRGAGRRPAVSRLSGALPLPQREDALLQRRRGQGLLQVLRVQREGRRRDLVRPRDRAALFTEAVEASGPALRSRDRVRGRVRPYPRGALAAPRNSTTSTTQCGRAILSTRPSGRRARPATSCAHTG